MKSAANMTDMETLKGVGDRETHANDAAVAVQHILLKPIDGQHIRTSESHDFKQNENFIVDDEGDLYHALFAAVRLDMQL